MKLLSTTLIRLALNATVPLSAVPLGERIYDSHEESAENQALTHEVESDPFDIIV